MGLGGISGPLPSPGGSRELWEAPFPSLLDRVDQASSYPGDWDACFSPFLSPPPLGVLLAAVFAHSPSDAMTLQCPCNDTDLKTGCPSQRMSQCSQGVRSGHSQVSLQWGDWAVPSAWEVRVLVHSSAPESVLGAPSGTPEGSQRN